MLTPRTEYLAGFIAATEDGQGGEFILENGPGDDRRAIVFPTRPLAIKAAKKHGYKYTRGYIYST